MRLDRRRFVAALCLLAITSCDNQRLLTPSRHGAGSALASAAAETAPERGCARIEVSLGSQDVDATAVTQNPAGACGTGLRILVQAARYDKKTDVVQLSVALENAGERPVRQPARLYARDEELHVLFPPGLAKDKPGKAYVAFAGADETAAELADALVWRFDDVLAPSGEPQVLPAGAQSGVRTVAIMVHEGVHRFELTVSAEARPSVPAAPIRVLIEEGVVGTPNEDVVTADVGDRVQYSFSPAPGYQNVRARIDGARADASGSITADLTEHVIAVSADRIVTVPEGAEALYATARGVLTAADPVAAYQAYLDAIVAHIGAAAEQDRAVREVRDVGLLAFDPLTEEDNLRRVDAALHGRTFRIGPDPGSEHGASPAFNRVAPTRHAAPARNAASVASVAGASDAMEPTTFLYVNGIWTDLDGAALTSGLLGAIVRSIPEFRNPNARVRYFYNRTWRDQPLTGPEKERRCASQYSRRKAANMLGTYSQADFMVECMASHEYYNWSDEELRESLRQIYDIKFNTDAAEADAVLLAGAIQGYRDAGDHVILVPHSQGNLMANQAIHRMRYVTNVFTPETEVPCIGVVSLASPVSVRWDVANSHYIAPVRVEGDPVPGLGNSAWPALSTVLSRDVMARTVSLPEPIRSITRDILGFTVLHAVEGSYFKDEALDAVKEGLISVSGACGLHMISPSPSQIAITRGTSQTVSLRFVNTFGDAIAPRPVTWRSTNPAIVTVTSGGTVTGVAPGRAAVQVSTSTRTIEIAVNVTDRVYYAWDFETGVLGEEPSWPREVECEYVPRPGGTMRLEFVDLPFHFPLAVLTIDWDAGDEETYPSHQYTYYRWQTFDGIELEGVGINTHWVLKWAEGRTQLKGDLDFLAWRECNLHPDGAGGFERVVLPVTFSLVR